LRDLIERLDLAESVRSLNQRLRGVEVEFVNTAAASVKSHLRKHYRGKFDVNVVPQLGKGNIGGVRVESDDFNMDFLFYRSLRDPGSWIVSKRAFLGGQGAYGGAPRAKLSDDVTVDDLDVGAIGEAAASYFEMLMQKGMAA
jgi:hypothetical protein